jgi:hypothetical protein
MKFEIHFKFRASLRKFQDLNFWDATKSDPQKRTAKPTNNQRTDKKASRNSIMQHVQMMAVWTTRLSFRLYKQSTRCGLEPHTSASAAGSAAVLFTLNRYSNSFLFFDARLSMTSTTLPGPAALKLPFMIGSSCASTFLIFYTMTVYPPSASGANCAP